jgi:GTPase KRas protein
MIPIYVIGMGGVGKSAITIRIVNDTFVEDYDPTIEDSYRKRIFVDGKEEIIEIVDTAGQEEYVSMRDNWAKSAQGFLIVYSITEELSFDEVNHRLEELSQYRDSLPPIIIVGNKIDLESERQVSKEQARTIADKWNCLWYETSAKDNTNVCEVFFEIVREIRKEKKRETARNLLKRNRKKKRCNIL